MIRKIELFPLFFLIFFSQCTILKKNTTADNVKASITKEGLINCFEKGLSANGQPIWCEASAIVYDGKNIFFANDKDMPDKRSSVFFWPFINGFADTTKPAEYLSNPLIKFGKKFEDFALTPNGKMVFLTTGFDRVQPGSKEWDSYNAIYYWVVGKQDNIRVLNLNNNDSTSIYLRNKISKVLVNSDFPAGMPYFKIEGLAATNDMLYFGIREEGKKYDDFKYKTKVLGVKYFVNNGTVQLDDEFSINDINITLIQPYPNQPLAISSIEYDHYNKRFLILTSFETGEKHGAYLWTATQNDLKNNKIHLVKDSQGSPLAFSMKAEDIAVINKKKIIIIHDDDRTMVRVSGRIRNSNQAAFSIVEFK